VASNKKVRSENWDGYGRKRSWPNFKVLCRHSPGGTDENHEKSEDSLCPRRDLYPRPPEYEAGMLTTQPCRSGPPFKLGPPRNHNLTITVLLFWVMIREYGDPSIQWRYSPNRALASSTEVT
jgi:hypothetical protein